MRLILIACALLLVFFLSSCVKLSHIEEVYTISCITYLRICRGSLPQEFAVAICRGNLQQEFAVGICRRNLSQEFAVAICRENLQQEFAVAFCRENLPWVFFECVREFFFVYVSKSCLYGSKPLLYVSKTF